MARIRSVKPGYFTSLDTAGQLSRDVRLHFIGLWTYADDQGRGVDDPRLIKAALWPLDDDVTTAVVEAWQEELRRAGWLVRYEADGRRYFEIDNFPKHQKPNRPQDSAYPAPDDPESTFTAPTVNEHGSNTEPALPEGRGEEGRGEEGSKEGSVAPAKPPRKPRSDDHSELFAALVEACGYTLPIPGVEGGKIGRCAKQLREIGATPDDVHRRAKAYRQRWPDIDLTPTGLVANWAQVTAKRNGNGQRVSSDACQKCGQSLQQHDSQLCAILAKAS